MNLLKFKILALILLFGSMIQAADTEKVEEFFADIRSDNIESIKKIIANNKDIINSRDVTGNPPLALTASKGKLEIAKILIDAGADVNAKLSCNWTILMYLCGQSGFSENRLEIAKLLLNAGANVSDTTDYDESALNLASSRGLTELVTLLLANNADISHKNKEGENSYDLALQSGYYGTAEVLKAWPEYMKELTKQKLDQENHLLPDLNQIVAEYLFG